MAKTFKELILLIERKLRNFSILKMLITVNNQETCIGTFINFFPSLSVFLFLSSSKAKCILKVKFLILMFPCVCNLFMALYVQYKLRNN